MNCYDVKQIVRNGKNAESPSYDGKNMDMFGWSKMNLGSLDCWERRNGPV